MRPLRAAARGFLSLSIRHKVLVLLLLNVFLVITIFSVFTYVSYKGFIENNVASAKQGLLLQTAENLEFIQQDIVDLSTYLIIDTDVQRLIKFDNEDVQELLSGDEAREADALSERSYLINTSFKFILTIMASKSHISSIGIYGENGFPSYSVSADTSSARREYEVIQQTDEFDTAVNKRGAPHWFQLPAGSNAFYEYNPFPKVAMIRTIKDLSGGKDSVLGILVMTVNEETIENIYRDSLEPAHETLFIFNERDQLVSGAGRFLPEGDGILSDKIREADARTGSFLAHLVGTRVFVNYWKSDAGWTYVHLTDTRLYLRETRYIRWLTLFAVVLCIALAVPLALSFSRFLTRPIQKLLTSMENFQQGAFDEQVQIKFKDELGQLGEGYNEMVRNIRRLIEEVYVLEIREREAELDALQAQINPHFLYNMLDTLSWKALRRGEEEISLMVRSLSKVFRLSLNQGHNLTELKNELDLIENYLTLQKMRFKSRLEYEIDIDDDLKEQVIPKLLLQPIVENAVVHSVEDTSETVTIRISGELRDQEILLRVEDDGNGMSPAELERVTSGNYGPNGSEPKRRGGYAMRNIRLRLKIYYGEDYEFLVRSKLGGGTTVEFRLPTNRLREGVHDHLTYR